MMFILSIVMLLMGSEKNTLTPDDFRRTITTYIDEHLGNSGIEREIEFRSLPKEMSVKKGNCSLRVAESEPMAIKGYIGIPVEVFIDGKQDRVVLCSVYIRTFENVFVTAGNVDKGSIFDGSWAVLMRVETTKYSNEDLITFRRQLSGLRTKRMLKERTILRASYFEIIPDIRQNDMVSVLVKTNNVVIGAAGIARQEGCIGDEIKIQRLGSKEILKGKVVGKNIVEVVTP